MLALRENQRESIVQRHIARVVSAIGNNNLEVLKEVIQRENVDMMFQNYGETDDSNALQIACERNGTSIFILEFLLLDMGADPGLRTVGGDDSMAIAIMAKNVVAVGVLLRCGQYSMWQHVAGGDGLLPVEMAVEFYKCGFEMQEIVKCMLVQMSHEEKYEGWSTVV